MTDAVTGSRRPASTLLPSGFLMTSATSLDRSPAQRFNTELGRLRTMLRRPAAPRELVLGQARVCGQYAYAASHPLEWLVELLASVVPADAHAVRTLPAEIVEAGTAAYLTEADRPRIVALE